MEKLQIKRSSYIYEYKKKYEKKCNYEKKKVLSKMILYFVIKTFHQNN